MAFDAFELNLRLGNEAMRTRTDVADALRRTAEAIEHSSFVHDGDASTIRDVNGNTVGSWRLGADTRYAIGDTLYAVLLGMQAAWIEWKRGRGADAAMVWIENTLDGGDSLPDADATDAQLFYDLGHSRQREAIRARQ